MPYRKVPLIPGQTYHVFNRSVGKQPIFRSKREFQRFLDLIAYYSYEKPSQRFSHFCRLPETEKNKLLLDLKLKKDRIVDIFGFCLMPNHYHLLVKERTEKGIANLVRNIQNSHARYFNIKEKRSGALFQAMFKAVRIEDDEQFVHLLRYIHLNPFTSYVVSAINDLEKYPYSSFNMYINNTENDILDKLVIKNYFKSMSHFKKFTYDQAEYQRQLENIKHLILE